MSLRPLGGYPTSWGNTRAASFPHTGPASYAQVAITPGSPIAAGDTVLASEAGMKYFDQVFAGVTDDGLFQVLAIPNSPSTSIPGAPATSYTLMWIALKTVAYGGQNQVFGTEAIATTDLAGETVRLTAIGPN